MATPTTETGTPLAAFEAKIVALIEEADTRIAAFEAKAADKRLRAELAAIDAVKASRQILEQKAAALAANQETNIARAKDEIDTAALSLKRALDDVGRKLGSAKAQK